MPAFNRLGGSASNDLGIGMMSAGRSMTAGSGLGDALGKQVSDMTDEEKLRRRLGLSVTQSSGSLAVQSLFGGVGGRSA